MVNITAFVIIAALLSGLALLSMSIPQKASAQCEEKGNPEKGATPFKCDFGDEKCTEIFTPNGKTHFQCKIG